jgi:nicotinamidase-related amidase
MAKLADATGREPVTLRGPEGSSPSVRTLINDSIISTQHNMKHSKALVIIDMQPDFNYSVKVIPEVVKAIEYAKAANEKIIIVEYDGSWFKPTHPEIMAALKGYEKKVVVKKQSADGSKEVMAALRSRRGLELKVCGVNLGACVWNTVTSLLERKSVRRINLLVSACNDYNVTTALETYSKHRKLKIQREL